MNIHWRIIAAADRVSPRLAHLLRFGTANVNSARHWDAAWARHGVDGFRATDQLNEVRRRVLAEVPVGATVLDVGCGVGELLALLHRDRDCAGAGVDISSVAIDHVRQQGFDGRVATLPEVPFESARFDVVISTETLEHVTDVAGAVREMCRVLRPGGRLLISVPDGASDREPVHVHRFTENSLRVLAAATAVQSVDVLDGPDGKTLFLVAVKRNVDVVAG